MDVKASPVYQDVVMRCMLLSMLLLSPISVLQKISANQGALVPLMGIRKAFFSNCCKSVEMLVLLLVIVSVSFRAWVKIWVMLDHREVTVSWAVTEKSLLLDAVDDFELELLQVVAVLLPSEVRPIRWLYNRTGRTLSG